MNYLSRLFYFFEYIFGLNDTKDRLTEENLMKLHKELIQKPLDNIDNWTSLDGNEHDSSDWDKINGSSSEPNDSESNNSGSNNSGQIDRVTNNK